VAPAGELPQKLIEFLKHIPAIRSDIETEVRDKSSLDKIIILLRTYTGNDFSLYKKNTLYRRIERRMSIHKIDKILSYVNYLQGNPKEVEILFKELLIGVTNFFRDAALWEKLKEIILPDILSGLQPGSILRAWVAGCSTGEEAYSLAIIFKEALEKIKPHGGFSLQIFATDIDADAIEIARRGLFSANIAADVSADRLNRFFINSEDGYRVKTEIREMVIFAQHNIILHPPFTRIDILSCRNLLIYMDPELQKKLIGLFYYSINPEGIMILGSSETLGSKSHLFTQVDAKLKIFKHSGTTHSPELFDFPSSFSRSKSTITEKPVPDRSGLNIQMLTDQLLLQYYSPSGVLVNEHGDIIYIHGHTGKYLEPAVGKANLNIFAMLREGLRTEFHSAFRRVVSKKETVVLRNLRIGTNGNTQILNIDIKWIDKPELLYGTVLIIFTDVREVPDIHLHSEKHKKGFNAIKQKELESELQRVREEMQNTLEEVQTSQEELRSTNEELQSTNEELQSTNEELTTSKEEMQSLNEELQTLNAELQAKVDDYSRVNNDMKNLLNSTEIATLFLDKELNIRRYTQQATKIFKLIKSDIGRPFTDIFSELIYPDLADDAIEVLRTLVYMQKEIPTNDNRWLLIRIMPYRTFDDKIDGIVITFIDVTGHKKIETKLAEAEKIKSILISTFANIEIELTDDWKILHMSPDAEEFFGISSKDSLKRNFINLFIPETLRRKTEKNIKMHLVKAFHDKLKLKVTASNGQTRVVECFVTSYLGSMNKEKTIKISIIKKQNYE
jgi:two-component system CheB/CheR fusion protein